MSRNFLFAANDEDVALTRLLATGYAVTGFLSGTPGAPLPGSYVLGEDNSAFLQTLYSRLEQAYPHAGQPFYAVRLWTNLMWQPAYLAAVAAHAHRAVPDFSKMAQQMVGNDVSGFRIKAGPQRSGELETLILEAGRDLRQYGDQVLAEINTITRLKRVPAMRLLADRMLSIGLRFKRFQPDLTIADQQRLCALWLKAMGLAGMGELQTLDLHDGQQVLITARKGCCLDYLAFPDTYCASCPKQDDAVRLERQRRDAIAELDAVS